MFIFLSALGSRDENKKFTQKAGGFVVKKFKWFWPCGQMVNCHILIHRLYLAKSSHLFIHGMGNFNFQVLKQVSKIPSLPILQRVSFLICSLKLKGFV
jgi:hypothetical protein